ncbi:ABC transporter permease [Streptomyces mobaraensis]|uniref:ABC transporter permease n=1 Tax=Streptomyces mobaraensis TaxID=35621 RepID=UPI00332E20EF
MTNQTPPPGRKVPQAPQTPGPPEAPTRFRDLLTAEWIKTRSLRSTPWTLALTLLFVVGSAVAATASDHHTRPGPADFLSYDAYPPAGSWTLTLVAGSVGALTVVSEYSTGLIRATTVAVPARGSVVLAKAVVTAVLWTVVGTLASVGSFLASQAILNERHAGVPITHPGVFRALAATALLAPVCALVGLGLGVLLRHSAATMVATVFLLLMLAPMFSERVRWAADVKHATVSSAWSCLVQSRDSDPASLAYSPTVTGSWAVYVLWPLLTVAPAVLVVRRRDV